MIQLEYTQSLTDAGLSPDQAVIYEVLLKLGEAPASKLAKSAPASLSRPLVYKVLEELIELDLAAKNDPAGKVATFSPKHPVAINQAIDQRKEQIERTREEFLATSGKLTSLFNLTSGKPGVQFYEGKEGVETVLAHTLNATSAIYTYVDTDAIEEYVKEINSHYVKKRLATGINKKILMMDSALAREKASNNSSELTEIKLISAKEMPSVPAVLEIYDEYVAYITFTNGILTATLITDNTIATLHRFLFESHWDCARAVN